VGRPLYAARSDKLHTTAASKTLGKRILLSRAVGIRVVRYNSELRTVSPNFRDTAVGLEFV